MASSANVRRRASSYSSSDPTSSDAAQPRAAAHDGDGDGDGDDAGTLQQYDLPALDEDWEYDTDEIRAMDSDELRARRPNRWRGPVSTWRHFTRGDRLVQQGLLAERGRDLAAHLYDAFRLANREQEPLPEEVSLPAL